MGAGRYRFVPRPITVEHAHPFLVFDGENRLHMPLTIFASRAAKWTAKGTVRNYLYHLLPFFTYLDAHGSQHNRMFCSWESDPDVIRAVTETYLIEELGCKVVPHDLGFLLVYLTDHTHTAVHITLASLKLFYKAMRIERLYPFENPFIDQYSLHVRELEARQRDDVYPPPMPPESGMGPPPRKRLTASYFKLVGAEWIPQIIDDVNFPEYLFTGAYQLKRWGLRDDCVTRLLFETGARISEVVGLTLGGWNEFYLLQQARTFNKGSNGIHNKTLRFRADTAKLLRRYFDTERRRIDAQHMTLDSYLRQHKERRLDLYTVPLFLSQRGTPYSAKTYREHVWNPACQAAGIEANIHQTRHWYVTMAIRDIYQHYHDDAKVQLEIQKLIGYMHWRSGEETMAAYEHYVKSLDPAETNARVHESLEVSLQNAKRTIMERQAANKQSMALPLQSLDDGTDTHWGSGPADEEFAFLLGRRSNR
jgi:integrase